MQSLCHKGTQPGRISPLFRAILMRFWAPHPTARPNGRTSSGVTGCFRGPVLEIADSDPRTRSLRSGPAAPWRGDCGELFRSTFFDLSLRPQQLRQQGVVAVFYPKSSKLAKNTSFDDLRPDLDPEPSTILER